MVTNLNRQKVEFPLAQAAAPVKSAAQTVAREKFSIFIAHPSHFLTDHRPSGDGLVAFDLIYQLAKRGHDLHIAVADADLRDELPENVKLYPIKTRTAPLSMLWRLEYAVKVKKLFEKLARETPFDVIHQLNPVVTGLSLFLGGTKTPLVLGPYVPYWSKSFEIPNYQPTRRESAIDSAKDFVLTKILHRQQKLANALLVSSPAALVKISGKFGGLEKTHELPYIVDVESFSPAEKTNDAEPPSILFLANLRYQKGIYTLLEAFEIIARTHPTCRLTIGGGGEEAAEIRRRINALNLESRVTLTGNVERRDVPRLLRECTVYCLPSYGEPFGMSAVEAMACGKPIVATDVGGLSFIVTGEGGRKVPPKDAPALARALLEILDSKTLQRKMGAFNRRTAVETYAAANIVERLEDIYRQIIQAESI